MLGLVIAMEEEMQLLLKDLNKSSYQKKEDVFIHYKFNVDGQEIIAVISGVGKIKASAATEYLISNFEISKVLNFGMAGGISPAVEIGDIINIQTSYDYDEDLSAFGREKVARRLETIESSKFRRGICVSGDRFMNDATEALEINKDYNALCYEMELSAISMVCNLHKIPIISLKYISDKADETADIDFDETLKIAMHNFSDFLIEMISSL